MIFLYTDMYSMVENYLAAQGCNRCKTYLQMQYPAGEERFHIE